MKLLETIEFIEDQTFSTSIKFHNFSKSSWRHKKLDRKVQFNFYIHRFFLHKLVRYNVEMNNLIRLYFTIPQVCGGFATLNIAKWCGRFQPEFVNFYFCTHTPASTHCTNVDHRPKCSHFLVIFRVLPWPQQISILIFVPRKRISLYLSFYSFAFECRICDAVALRQFESPKASTSAAPWSIICRFSSAHGSSCSVLSMGLCKCRVVTTLFCFQHRINVCENCLVDKHKACVVQTYLQWLQDSDFDPTCRLCSGLLDDQSETIRLPCLRTF